MRRRSARSPAPPRVPACVSGALVWPARAACRDTRPAQSVLPACAATARSAFFPRWWLRARGDCRRRQSLNPLRQNFDTPPTSRSRISPRRSHPLIPGACLPPLHLRRSGVLCRGGCASDPPSISISASASAGPGAPLLWTGGLRAARGFLRPRRPLSRPRSPEKEARVPHEPRRWRQRKGTRRWRAEAAGVGDDDQ